MFLIDYGKEDGVNNDEGQEEFEEGEELGDMKLQPSRESLYFKTEVHRFKILNDPGINEAINYRGGEWKFNFR